MIKFFVLFNVSPISTIKQDRESGVDTTPLLNGNSRSEQDMNLKILAATISPLKCSLITLQIWRPIPPSKEREDEEIALKFPLVLA